MFGQEFVCPPARCRDTSSLVTGLILILTVPRLSRGANKAYIIRPLPEGPATQRTETDPSLYVPGTTVICEPLSRAFSWGLDYHCLPLSLVTNFSQYVGQVGWLLIICGVLLGCNLDSQGEGARIFSFSFSFQHACSALYYRAISCGCEGFLVPC